MKLNGRKKGIVSKILAGNHPIREYSTVTIEGDIREQVYLRVGKRMIDISRNHWLLCLEPVVFGVWAGQNEAIGLLKEKSGYRMYFRGGVEKNAEAILDLEFLDWIEEEGGCLFLLKLTHTIIRPVHPLSSLLLFLQYYKKPGLTYKKYRSFIAAFCYPRQVRLVSYRKGIITRCSRWILWVRSDGGTGLFLD